MAQNVWKVDLIDDWLTFCCRLLDVQTWPEAGIKFDVITCLNLLDRCDRPLSLLDELKASLSPGGRVVVALVLPFNPYVEIGKLTAHSSYHTEIVSTIFVFLFSAFSISRLNYRFYKDMYK
jgi:2-polyprenyl-3-methyl-5-hydroxy-6-metoxy-1,4-benzoquinol methylase